MNTMNPFEDDIVINAHSIKKSIHGTEIIHGIDMSIRKGRIYALLGPNGAGKTTTTRLLTGILHPDSGDVSLFGERLDKNNAHLLRRRIGMQVDGNAYEDMTVKDNIALWMNIYNVYDEKTLKDVIHEFGLSSRMNDKVSELSKGNRQKILIARALSVQPDILFLDEPTSGLDPESADSLMELLHESSVNRGLTVFMCTHRLQGLSGIIDDVGFLENGSLTKSGSVKQLIRQYWNDDMYTLSSTGDIGGILQGRAEILESDGHSFTIRCIEPPDTVIKRLVEHDCPIYEFTRIHHDIHDLYFRIIRGKEEDD